MPLATITLKVQDVFDYVVRQFGDEANVQIAAADIIRWVNMAQRELLASNPVIKGSATANLVAGQTDYDLSVNQIMKIQSIRVNGLPIDYRNFTEFEEYVVSQDPNNVQQGLPYMWTEWGGTVTIYPAPSTNMPNGLKVFYFRSAPTVAALSDALGVPDEFFNRICEYVMAQIYELDEDQQNSAVKLQAFAQGLATQSDADTDTDNKTYPMISSLDDDEWY